jgi:VanZ family protein
VSRARLALSLAVAVILGATLLPIGTPAPLASGQPWLNWSFPLADMVRNWLLFIPLGAALRSCGMRGRRALAIGVGLSLGIETLQSGIHGRETALSDVLANALGTGAGIGLVRTAPHWISVTGRRAKRHAAAAAAIAVAAMLATGALLAPAATTAPLWAHHTPRMDNFQPYTGRVLEADLDGIELPYGELADSRALGAHLNGDYTLRVIAEAGDPPAGQAALLLVTDQRQQEILLLGPDAEDLVLRFRNRGEWLGLETARIRDSGALRGLAVGERIRLEAVRKGADLCLDVNGSKACGLGFTIGDGWSLLVWDQPALARHRRLLGAIWLGMLLFPLGFWGNPSKSTAAAGGAVVAGMLLAPAATGLLPTPLWQLLGAAGGAAAGGVAGRALRAR